jgi:hypothetical protein
VRVADPPKTRFSAAISIGTLCPVLTLGDSQHETETRLGADGFTHPASEGKPILDLFG